MCYIPHEKNIWILVSFIGHVTHTSSAVSLAAAVAQPVPVQTTSEPSLQCSAFVATIDATRDATTVDSYEPPATPFPMCSHWPVPVHGGDGIRVVRHIRPSR